MADDELLGDDIEGRTQAFFARMGIHEWFFTTAIQRSVERAIGDPADAAQRPWQPIGGRNIGGRARALARDAPHPLHLYARAAPGGACQPADRARPAGAA